jgi:hypothetical protein
MNLACRVLVLLVSFLAFVHVASAGSVGGPTQGLWWNPNESGRGYQIDLQGSTMIVTTYVYEESGDPIWYLSSGTYDHASSTFSSVYDIYANGQCFGCDYVAPAHTGNAGPITIVFSTNQTATLTYPGGSTDIVKFNYAYGTRTDALYGEWALSYETGGVVGGDWIVFDTSFTDTTTGNVYASGYAAGNTATTALGIFDTTHAEAQIAVTAGATGRFYEFGVFDDRRVIGTVTSTTGTTTTGPYTATGARLLYKDELANRIIGAQAAMGGIQSMPAPDDAAKAALVARFESLRDASRKD